MEGMLPLEFWHRRSISRMRACMPDRSFSKPPLRTGRMLKAESTRPLAARPFSTSLLCRIGIVRIDTLYVSPIFEGLLPTGFKNRITWLERDGHRLLIAAVVNHALELRVLPNLLRVSRIAWQSSGWVLAKSLPCVLTCFPVRTTPDLHAFMASLPFHILELAVLGQLLLRSDLNA